MKQERGRDGRGGENQILTPPEARGRETKNRAYFAFLRIELNVMDLKPSTNLDSSGAP
jgi:hypothetical protein